MDSCLAGKGQQRWSQENQGKLADQALGPMLLTNLLQRADWPLLLTAKSCGDRHRLWVTGSVSRLLKAKGGQVLTVGSIENLTENPELAENSQPQSSVE